MEKKNNELATEEINLISEELSEECPLFSVKDNETLEDAIKRYLKGNRK